MGRRLVSLDYSGIELRVLALLSNDAQLLEDVVFGDVHSEVASKMAGRKIDKSKPQDKALRSKAKGVSFGIIYGSGAAGLAGTMRTTPDNAQDYIEFWATRYKNAFNYRYKMLDEALQTRFIKTIDGGTIYMGKNPELPRCANYPVQRAALSVMARAIVRHKESLDFLRADGSHKMTKMLATIHDALITETASKDAQEVLQIMSKDMILAYQDLFPDAPVDALVEGGIGTDWSALG
jgi:DNA polymerase-1